MDNEERKLIWSVDFTNKSEKQADKLPADIRIVLHLLTLDLEQKGPELTKWRNYGLIVGAKDVHHCHLNNARPRYIVVWKVSSREKREIEIRFVGTHGSVNYTRFR